jgi:hypothetical protein
MQPRCIYAPSQIMLSTWKPWFLSTLYLLISTYKFPTKDIYIFFNLSFQSFDCDRIVWRLFQKPVVCTKLDIYGFITVKNTFTGYIFFVICNINTTIYRDKRLNNRTEKTTEKCKKIYPVNVFFTVIKP